METQEDTSSEIVEEIGSGYENRGERKVQAGFESPGEDTGGENYMGGGLSDDSQGEEETTAAIYKIRRSRAQKEAILATGRLICAPHVMMNAESTQGGQDNSRMHAAGSGTMGPRKQVQVRKPNIMGARVSAPRKSTKGVDKTTTAVLKSNGSADKPSEIEIKALQGVLKDYGLKKMPTVKSMLGMVLELTARRVKDIETARKSRQRRRQNRAKGRAGKEH